MTDNERPGMPPLGHYTHLGPCFDACESYPELRLLQELVAWPRSKFIPGAHGVVGETRDGVVLHQQYPILDYRFDFALTSKRTLAKLDIEVDGASFHGTNADRERDEIVSHNGWEVLRIPAASITRTGGAKECVELILEKFHDIQKSAMSVVEAERNVFLNLAKRIPGMSVAEIADTFRVGIRFHDGDSAYYVPPRYKGDGDPRRLLEAPLELRISELSGALSSFFKEEDARKHAMLDELLASLQDDDCTNPTGKLPTKGREGWQR